VSGHPRQFLLDYEALTGRTVIRQQVRVTLPDGTTRYYDGLALKPDGTYEGIEVKSGGATLEPGQRAFDNQIKSGSKASGTLNGKPITVTSVRLLNVQTTVPSPTPVTVP
jgi:hypothetical protein